MNEDEFGCYEVEITNEKELSDYMCNVEVVYKVAKNPGLTYEKIIKKVIDMNKEQIIETAFETIKESTEWGMEDKSDRYGRWIDGVVTVVDRILDILKEENDKTIEN